jgi:hypothetical protein
MGDLTAIVALLLAACVTITVIVMNWPRAPKG